MKLNSAQLEAFFTVAQLQNFTRAAEVLHVTQSALSQRIAKLEEELETTLFIRERTSIRLTEFGEQVLRFCQVSQNAESDLLSRLKNSQNDLAGVLRIGGFSSVNNSLVVPALSQIMKKNSRLSIQLLTREVKNLEPLLKTAQADYIITTQNAESPDLVSHFLGFEENVLVMSKKYEGPDIYIDHDENDLVTKEYFKKFKLKFKPASRRFLDDIHGLMAGVRQGYGKAILPLHLIQNEKEFEIIAPDQIMKTPVYLQYYSQPYYRRIHNVFIEDIQKFFKANLAQK